MKWIDFTQSLEKLRIHVIAVFAGLCVAGTSTAAAVQANPDSLRFESKEASAVIKLTHDGEPVPASAINSWRFLVDDSDYNHMLDVDVADGQVTVSPSEQAEIGSFRLAIDTAHGEANVAVYTPLRDPNESLAHHAEHLGISVEELKVRLGLAQVAGRERMELNLPPVYYLGQELHMDIGLAPGRTAKWTINGDPILPSDDDGHFEFLFTEPGVYVIGYSEMDDGVEVTTGYDVTTVIGEPPVRRTIMADSRLDFHGPTGFTTYKWMVDGMVYGNGTDMTFSHRFDTPGTYEVVVRAEDGAGQRFRQVTYIVTVQ